MAKTFPQLYQQCDGITNEQQIGGNTKEKIGDLFHNIVEKIEEVANSELPSRISELEAKEEVNKEVFGHPIQLSFHPSALSQLSLQQSTEPNKSVIVKKANNNTYKLNCSTTRIPKGAKIRFTATTTTARGQYVAWAERDIYNEAVAGMVLDGYTYDVYEGDFVAEYTAPYDGYLVYAYYNSGWSGRTWECKVLPDNYVQEIKGILDDKVNSSDIAPLNDYNEIQGLGVKTYQGERIKFDNIYSWKPFASNSWTSLQSAACYGDYLVEVKDGLSQIGVYDLKNKQQVASCVPTEQTTNTGLYHCNSCSFSNLFYDEDDTFPILYIAERNNSQRRCFFMGYRLQLLEGELKATHVHTIYLPPMTDVNCLGNANVAFDIQGGYMYTYSRNNNSTAANYNDCVISKFEIPTNISSNIILEDSDILDSYSVGISAVDMQDGFIRNGKLYIGQGYAGHGFIYIQVIDLVQRQRVSVVDLYSSGWTGEPESIFYYNKHLMMRTLSKNIWEFLFD